MITKAFWDGWKLIDVDVSQTTIAQDQSWKKIQVVKGAHVPWAKPFVPQPKPVASEVVRPWAYWMSDWRSYQALRDAGKKIIEMRNNQNKDINTAQTMWDTAYKDTSPFGWQRAEGTPWFVTAWDSANFRELNPWDQASLTASKRALALANLQTISNERDYREKVAWSALWEIKDMYQMQQAAKERETDNLRQTRADERADLAAGLSYVDSEWNVVRWTPPSLWDVDFNSYISNFWWSITQWFDTPVSYIPWRKIHWWYDISMNANTVINSPVEQWTVVEVTKDNWKWTWWWNSVVIRDNNWNQWRFAHLNNTALSVGEKIWWWQVIWYSWSTWESTWPHLHIEVKDKNGKLFDPKNILSSWIANKRSDSALNTLYQKAKKEWYNYTIADLNSFSEEQLAELESTFEGKKVSSIEERVKKVISNIPTSAYTWLVKKFNWEDWLEYITEMYYTEWDAAAKNLVITQLWLTAEDYDDFVSKITLAERK